MGKNFVYRQPYIRRWNPRWRDDRQNLQRWYWRALMKGKSHSPRLWWHRFRRC